jgi:uncharacterized protein YndB with AHSA1/START domain
MPTARRTRRLDAPPERLWDVVADPHHMARWWPEVRRMEGVSEDRFTQVFMTKKGRAVRADQYLVEVEPPVPGSEDPARICWTQEIEGTPFERVLEESVTEVVLEAVDGGTLVTISQSQKLRGYSRTGGFLLRRATRRKLDQALDGLEQVVA